LIPIRLFLGWTLIAPLALLFPKIPNRIIVIGRGENCTFSGNAKYFFLHLQHIYGDNLDVRFITNDPEAYNELQKNGLTVLHDRYPDKIALLKAAFVVTDSSGWVKYEKYLWSLGSKKIQLWHGVVPLKVGELDNMHERDFARTLFGKAYNKLIARFPNYDLLVIGNEKYTKTYQREFAPKLIQPLGYSQNDAQFSQKDEFTPPLRHIMINVDRSAEMRIKQEKKSGHKIIWYTPTFRDSGADSFPVDSLDCARLVTFLKKNNCTLLASLHPYSSQSDYFSRTPEVILAKQGMDIFPLINLTDILITDYSTIYFDYLITDKPILFFQHDLNSYITKERELINGYEDLMPGPQCITQDELEEWILRYISDNGDDPFHEKRRSVRDTVFQYQDGRSSERIWSAMNKL